VDAQIKTIRDQTPDGEPIICRYHDPHVFPPGGKRTPMRWCRSCGRYTPPNNIHLIESRTARGVHAGNIVSATLQCDDCRINIGEEIHRELYAAFPHLRPAGSMSVVHRHELRARRRQAAP
jgi:hypothetical protein